MLRGLYYASNLFPREPEFHYHIARNLLQMARAYARLELEANTATNDNSRTAPSDGSDNALSPSQRLARDAVDRLNAVVALNPLFPDAHAMLAYAIPLLEPTDSARVDLLSLALSHASTALDLAPSASSACNARLDLLLQLANVVLNRVQAAHNVTKHLSAAYSTLEQCVSVVHKRLKQSVDGGGTADRGGTMQALQQLGALTLQIENLEARLGEHEAQLLRDVDNQPSTRQADADQRRKLSPFREQYKRAVQEYRRKHKPDNDVH
jgi:hypothetical protein